MNEDIKVLKKQYHVTNYDIGEYLDYSGDYIRCILNKELEARELLCPIEYLIKFIYSP